MLSHCQRQLFLALSSSSPLLTCSLYRLTASLYPHIQQEIPVVNIVFHERFSLLCQ
jgi:hypothetical protein